MEAFDWNKATIAHWDRLPHVRQDGVVYFVTFRLADSIPAEVVHELRQSRDSWLARNPKPHSAEQERVYREMWTVRVENLMDNGHGECELRRPDCRALVEATLRHDDGVAYDLGDFVIMPNHVHALVEVRAGGELSAVVQSWKSISARRINRSLGRRGQLWQEEYFDHIVRDGSALEKIENHVRRNPGRLAAGEFTLGRGRMK